MPSDGKSYEEMMTPEELAKTLGQGTVPGIQGVPTTATAWRSAQKTTITIQLPSGNVAQVRRTMDLMKKLKNGEIPNPLASIVMKMIEGGEERLDMRKLDEKALGQMIKMLDDNAAAALVSPKCVVPPDDRNFMWEPPDDCISTDDLTLEDKTFLFAWANGGTADLATFRKQSALLMESVQNGQGILGEA